MAFTKPHVYELLHSSPNSSKQKVSNMEQVNLNYKMYLFYYDYDGFYNSPHIWDMRRFHQIYRDNPTSRCHHSWCRFCDRLLAVMIGVITLTGLTMIGVMNSIGYMGIGPILIISIALSVIVAKMLWWFIKEFTFITSLVLSAFTDWLFDKMD